MKIAVDSSRCQGHGNCYARHPDLFTPDDEGYATAIADEVAEASRADALHAVGGCPERAITVE